jgi:putative selenate reductase FAD-binding subunit
MITHYHRPTSLSEALSLIARPTPMTVPLGGGTVLSRGLGMDVEVVDLQGCGLGTIERSGQRLLVGATATLQQLVDHSETPAALRRALMLEAPLNLRTTGTLAGSIMVADGRSPLVVVLLALDASLTIARANGNRAQSASGLRNQGKLDGTGGSGTPVTASRNGLVRSRINGWAALGTIYSV